MYIRRWASDSGVRFLRGTADGEVLGLISSLARWKIMRVWGCKWRGPLRPGFSISMSSFPHARHLRHRATSWIAFPRPTRWIKALGFHYCFKSGDWKWPGIWNVASRMDFNSSGWWIGSANSWGIPVSHKQIISLRPLIGNRLYWSRFLFFGQSANNCPLFSLAGAVRTTPWWAFYLHQMTGSAFTSHLTDVTHQPVRHCALCKHFFHICNSRLSRN